MTDLSGIVYQAIFGHCEDLEFRKVYQGNGHHLAQRLAEMVKEEFAKRGLKVVEAADDKREAVPAP